MDSSLTQTLGPLSQLRRLVGFAGRGLLCIALASCAVPSPEANGDDDNVARVLPEGREPAPPSQAETPRDYRRDGAEHIYRVYQDQIFKGAMPPLLEGIGVTRIFINANGLVTRLEWLRKPSDKPHVVRAIERMIRGAQPFPSPQVLGQVAYIDTWLWHKNGLFQLDTLTEGQLDRKPFED